MSKTMRSQKSKKKTIRTILIAAAVAVVIALIILLVFALDKDEAGMNCFQRKATVASAYGEKVSMAEYRVAYNQYYVYVQYAGWTPETIAQTLLLEKIQTKEAKALGLTLTKEEEEACKKTAQTEIDTIAKNQADYLVANNAYSKSALEKQLASLYERLGMTENEYYNYIKTGEEAKYYKEKLEAYYEEHGSGIDGDTLDTYYKEYIEKSMKTVDEEGKETPAYKDGDFWTAMDEYLSYGLVPMLYVPDNFIYIDYIKLESASEEEMQEVIRQVTEGEKTFDELMNGEENKSVYRGKLDGPYPIAEHDYGKLFNSEAAYTAASELEVGKVGFYMEAPVTAEDGTTTVTGYLFRRAVGKMCADGEYGIISMDYIPGIRGLFEEQYRLDQWFKDVKYEDALYSFKGVSE